MLGLFWVRNFGVRDRSLGGLILPSSALSIQDLLYLRHATCWNIYRSKKNGEHPRTILQRVLTPLVLRGPAYFSCFRQSPTLDVSAGSFL